jgi:hypothetical protein
MKSVSGLCGPVTINIDVLPGRSGFIANVKADKEIWTRALYREIIFNLNEKNYVLNQVPESSMLFFTRYFLRMRK